jgi:hypothetical protein
MRLTRARDFAAFYIVATARVLRGIIKQYLNKAKI